MRNKMNATMLSAIIFTTLALPNASARDIPANLINPVMSEESVIETPYSQGILGSAFTDSYSTTGIYSLVIDNPQSTKLTVILDPSVADKATNKGNKLFVTPPISSLGKWEDNQDLNLKWLQDLLSSQDFSQYKDITLVGSGESADFISQTIIARNPHRISEVILVNGGEYKSLRMTQASYHQLLTMKVRIINSSKDTATKIKNSYTLRGFQKVTFA